MSDEVGEFLIYVVPWYVYLALSMLSIGTWYVLGRELLADPRPDGAL